MFGQASKPDTYNRLIEEKGLQLSEMDGRLEWGYSKGKASVEYVQALARYFKEYEISPPADDRLEVNGDEIRLEAEHPENDEKAARNVLNIVKAFETSSVEEALEESHLTGFRASSYNPGP
ncbi:MAG: hypothetical protein ACLFTA_00830 [Candidatus Nanohaloarchaea archaeon]